MLAMLNKWHKFDLLWPRWVRLALGGVLLMGIGPASARQIWVDASDSRSADIGFGSREHPLRTIAYAASIADAGDVVTIKAGDYHEPEIVIPRSGKPGSPITFMAEQPGTVRLIGGNDVTDYTDDESLILWGKRPRQPENNELWTGATYITIRGLTLLNARGVAVAAGDGWRVEDCLIRAARFDGLVARGNDIAIERTVVENVGNNGMTGGFGRNIRISNSIIRRCNRMGNPPGGTSGASKFLWTHGLRIDGLISYDNFGSGFWLDWENYDYEITGSTLFGNHAGDALEKGKLVKQPWAGAGFWSEGNPGPGRITGNLIYSNRAAAIGILESKDVTIEDNDLYDCGVGIELRDMLRDDDETKRTHLIDNVVIRRNRFKAWTGDAAIATSIGHWQRGGKPRDYGVIVEGNYFDPGAVRSIVQWLSRKPATFSAAIDLLGSRGNQIRPIIPPAIRVTTHDTPLAEVRRAPGVRFRQIASDEAESLSIRQAITGHAIGQVVRVPAFGRTAFVQESPVASSCQVYDLATRAHLKLLLPSQAARQALQDADVRTHASLRPAWLSVRLTSVDPYALEAELLAALGTEGKEGG